LQVVKRDDDKAASAEATKKNAPYGRSGPRRRTEGTNAGERRGDGSRDAPAGARETRRRIRRRSIALRTVDAARGRRRAFPRSE